MLLLCDHKIRIKKKDDDDERRKKMSLQFRVIALTLVDSLFGRVGDHVEVHG